MTALLTENLPLLAGAPNGIKKLRELILELAVRGKLMPQDPSDEPASELLKRIAEEKARLVAQGKIKKQKPLAEIADDEKSFELPASWAWQRFADFALDVSTGPFGSLIHQSDYVDGGIPLVNPSHMIDGRIVADQSVSLSAEMAENLTSYRLSEGDMVMARRGEVGRVALVTRAEEGWLCGTGSFVLRFTAEVSRAYVWTLFRCNSVRTYLAGAAVGTTMVNLNHGILLKMPIAVPPLAEQHRIVAKVDELMALCDRLEARQADAESAHAQLVQALLDSLTQASDATDFAANWQRLSEHFHTLFTTEPSIDALKQTLLQLAVMGKLVPQDPSDEPADELLGKIAKEIALLHSEGKIRKPKPINPVPTEDEVFGTPQGWKWVRLSQITRQLGDGLHGTPSYSPNGEYHFVNGNNLKEGKIVIKPETKTVSESEYSKHKKPLDEQSILVSINGTIGSVAFYKSEKIVLGKSACYFNLASGVSKHFVRLLIEVPGFMKYALKSATGTTIKNLGLKAMNDYPIALPPLAEQHRIVAKLNQLMTLCNQLKTRLTQARQLNEQLASTLVEQAVA